MVIRGLCSRKGVILELAGGRGMWDVASKGDPPPRGSLVPGEGIHFPEPQCLPPSFGGDEGDTATPTPQGGCE